MYARTDKGKPAVKKSKMSTGEVNGHYFVVDRRLSSSRSLLIPISHTYFIKRQQFVHIDSNRHCPPSPRPFLSKTFCAPHNWNNALRRHTERARGRTPSEHHRTVTNAHRFASSYPKLTCGVSSSASTLSNPLISFERYDKTPRLFAQSTSLPVPPIRSVSPSRRHEL